MRFFCKRYFDWLFTAGLLFSALISVNRQYGFLPDFLEGALTGLAIVFLLLPGTLRHNKKLMKEMEVSQKDERIAQITGKAAETALYTVLLTGAVGAIAAGSFGEEGLSLSIAFVVMIAVAAVSFAAAKLCYSRKM